MQAERVISHNIVAVVGVGHFRHCPVLFLFSSNSSHPSLIFRPNDSRGGVDLGKGGTVAKVSKRPVEEGGVYQQHFYCSLYWGHYFSAFHSCFLSIVASFIDRQQEKG